MRAFKDAFWNYGSLIPLLYLPAAVTLVWLSWDGEISSQDEATTIFYLLSAQAQVLGTILALVFTTTIVAAQLASRYSQRVIRHVIGVWALYYLVPYLLAIAGPLFLLNGRVWDSGFYPWATRASLVLGGLCFALLIPYFTVIRRRLSPAFTIESLVAEARSCYYQRTFGGAEGNPDQDGMMPEAVSNLVGIAFGAAAAHDYETFREALRALEETGEFLLQRGTEMEEALSMLFTQLGNMARRSIGEPTVPFEVINALRELGTRAADQRLKDATSRALNTVRKIGYDASRRGAEDLTAWTVGALGILGERATDQRLEDVQSSAIRALEGIGQTAAGRSFDLAADRAVRALARMAHRALDDDELRVATSAIAALVNVGKACGENKREEASLRAAYSLQDLGAKAAQMDRGKIALESLDGLGEVTKAARGLEDVIKQGAWGLGQIVASTRGPIRRTATIKAISLLKEVYSMTQADEQWNAVKQIAVSLSHLGTAAAECGNRDPARDAWQVVKEIGEAAAKSSQWDVMEQVAQCIGFMAPAAARGGLGDLVEEMYQSLNGWLQEALKATQWRVVRQLAESLGYLGQAAAERNNMAKLAGWACEALEQTGNEAVRHAQWEICKVVAAHAGFVAERAVKNELHEVSAKTLEILRNMKEKLLQPGH